MHANTDRDGARRPRRQRAFLKSLAHSVNVARACRTAGIPRRTAYHWRDADPRFARQWDDALDDGIDLLEAELHRRAFEGVEKPVWHKGEQVGTVRHYSDALAMFLLKAHRPARYRDGYRPPDADRLPRAGAAAGADVEMPAETVLMDALIAAAAAPATATVTRVPAAAVTAETVTVAGTAATAATATVAGAAGTGARAPAFPPPEGGGMNGAGGGEARDPSRASRRRTTPADARESTPSAAHPGTDSETCWTPSSRRRSRSPRSRSVSAASSGGSRAPGRGWS